MIREKIERPPALVVFIALILAGCSSSAPAALLDAGIVGVVDGRPFAIADSIWTTQVGDGFDFNGPATYLDLGGYKSVCQQWQAGTGVANGQDLILGIAAIDQSGNATAPSQPGDYVVVAAHPAPSSNSAEAYYQGGCYKADLYAGVFGSVHIASISNIQIAGSFDIVMSCQGFASCASDGGVHLVGTFNASSCAALDVNRSLTCPADGGV
jgi:hypothetical protein